MRTILALAATSLFVATTAAQADQLQAMERVGFGVALAEATQGVCYYAPETLETLDQMASKFWETSPGLWERVMEVSHANAAIAGNFANTINPEATQCQIAGLGVSDALVYHIVILGPNPIVLKEMERLGKRGGRLATEDELRANEVLEGDL